MPLVDKLLRLLPPEAAHRASIRGLSTAQALRIGLGPSQTDDPILATQLYGLRFPNPVGLAAGFDKNAEVPDAMLAMGFGFVEVGTVTPLPQAGNSKPRIFRDVTGAAIVNRLGFNGEGLNAAERRLAKRDRAHGIVGANVGRNKDSADGVADYVAGVRRLGPLAAYVVVNVSSPNTPGLRDLQERAALEALLAAVVAARDESCPGRPLLVKIAPDLDDAALDAIIGAAIDRRADGLILGNTTISRPGGVAAALARETGGLSGKPLFAPSTERLLAAARLAKGRMPLVGVGGISSGADAFAKIAAGASLVQAYSGMVFAGTGFARAVKFQLADILRERGFTSLTEAVGSAL